MRKHRVIRQEEVQNGTIFQFFDIETGQFDNLMFTLDATGAVAVGALVISPTINKSSVFPPPANFPGVPVNLAGGTVTYVAIGPGCQIAFPLPDMISVGVICGNGTDVITVKIEGDGHESHYPDPSEAMLKNRA
jgi:hypothetical protein